MRGVLVLGASVVALAGCGVAPSAQDSVAGAGSASAKARTAHFVASWEGEAVVEGIFDLDRGTGVMFGSDARPETIVAKEALYQLIPEDWLAPLRWVRYERQEFSALVIDPPAESPEEILDLLSAATGVHAVGRGQERGTTVTRYTAELSLERMLEQWPEEERPEMRDYYAEWINVDEPLRVQLALDADGRIRRGDLEGFPERITYEFFDYGVGLDLRSPSQSEVIAWREYERLLTNECERQRAKGGKPTPYCALHCAAEGEGKTT